MQNPCRFFRNVFFNAKVVFRLLRPKRTHCTDINLSPNFIKKSKKFVTHLQWTDRLDTLRLGRCSCTNQVSSVSLSVLCRRRMDISPVTQKKGFLFLLPHIVFMDNNAVVVVTSVINL